MAFNNHTFLVLFFSFLVSFPADAHRSLSILLLDQHANGTNSSNPILSTISNVMLSSISLASFASPSPALSPESVASQEEEDTIEYEEALVDYLGSNVQVEFQKTITGHVQNIVNEIKEKTLVFVQETIEKRLANSDGNDIKKNCLNVCKSNYEELGNDVTEVLKDFSMTRNLEMVSDYLHGLSYDVQSCRNCRAEISLEQDPEFNKFDEWLTAFGIVSAAELNKTIHA